MIAVVTTTLATWPHMADTPARPARILPPTVAPANHKDAVAQLDRDLATAHAEAAKRADDWLALERIATIFMARARLTGHYDDFTEAGAALDRAFAVSGPRAGPHLAAAALAMQTHQLGRAEAILAEIDRYAMPAEAEIRAEAEAMRGDIALYRGRYTMAARRYDAAEALVPSAGLFARRAILDARMGRSDRALAELDRAEHMGDFTTPQAAAGLKLQRGTMLLQIGRWNDAERAFAEADRLFPGHWQTEQNRAQMAALHGDMNGAIRLYRIAIAQAGAPETMDALAALYRAQGDYRSAETLVRAADGIWAVRLKTFPEAAQAHALDHYLAFGPTAATLELALAGYHARPHGASAVALGWALLANRRTGDALRIADAVTRSGWVSAEQHMLAADAQAILGRGKDAAKERDAASAINPRILDRRAALIWFGH